MQKFATVCCFATMAFCTAAEAQWTAGSAWRSGYAFPSQTDSYYKSKIAEQIKSAESGYYENVGKNITNNYTTTNNSSTISYTSGDVTVGDGATATIDTRTGESVGDETYVVGAINTTENNLDVSGNGNNVDITSSADSVGCQDGSMSNTTVPGVSALSSIDISTGLANGGGTCN